MNRTFDVISYDGLHTDSLGHYLAGLGLLVAISSRWPSVRGCWRNRRFVLLTSDGLDDEQVTKFLLNDWRPTKYERWWEIAQKADTKAKSSLKLWKERNRRPLAETRLLDAHIVGFGRNCFNPVLGTGGNIAKRDLAKVWKDASKLLAKKDRSDWLDATLHGAASIAIPDLGSGGTWFVFANKTFNSGQDWYREGRLSPWSFLLAMEGAFQLVGGVSRRLGVRARPYAVFPFIAEPSQPETDGEIGMSRAEFWAPLWSQPATAIEVRQLLKRGLAKLGGRAAQAPHEFAVAALSAGVDSGISEFARYELRQTTSSQVYEAIPREHIEVIPAVMDGRRDTKRAQASRILAAFLETGWLDRIPYEPRDSKQKGKFVGLRGPIGAAIVRIGERPEDAERWQDLLLRLAAAQTKIDRNKTLREHSIAIQPLSPRWFELAWDRTTLPVEIEAARAIASLGWNSRVNDTNLPLLANTFGIEPKFRAGRWTVDLPNVRPATAVWVSGDPLQLLLDVAQRRLIDGNSDSTTPFGGTQWCGMEVVNRLMQNDGSLDLDVVAKWIPAFSLIDWSQDVTTDTPARSVDWHLSRSDGTALLHGLIRPLFYCDASHNVTLQDKSALFRRDQMPKLTLLRRLFHLLRFNAIDEAVQIARDRYLANGRNIVAPPLGMQANGSLIAAALLIPVSHRDVVKGIHRWLPPLKKNRFSSQGKLHDQD